MIIIEAKDNSMLKLLKSTSSDTEDIKKLLQEESQRRLNVCRMRAYFFYNICFSRISKIVWRHVQ